MSPSLSLCVILGKVTSVVLCLPFKMMIIALSCRAADKLNEIIHGKC